MLTLATERLILRQFRQSDFDAFAAMLADPEVMRYVGPVMTREQAWRQLALMAGHWQLLGYGFWAIEERGGGELIGRVGCWRPEGWPGFEVGWLLRRDRWGRGYATEGGRAAMAHAFRELNQPRVVSVIHPDNESSIRVALKLGERYEGPCELAGLKLSVYGISRAEWEGKSCDGLSGG
jgi:RimJ/RimL family protein N-acetyltransferase